MKDTIKYIIRDFHESGVPELRRRKIHLPLDLNKIISIVGIRRSGKTYLCYDTIQRLLEQGIELSRCIYLNFEDDRLFPFTLNELDLILKAYNELYPQHYNQTKYLFLDEIQRIENWGRYIRRIYDTENVRIYVTGSSSQLAAGALSSALRGREIRYHVTPLSFKEYLDFRDIEEVPFSTHSDVQIRHALYRYLHWGGFPEVVLIEDDYIRRKILQEYSDLILYKDLIEHYGIHNHYLLKYLLKHTMSNPATLLSLNKLYRDLKSQGLSLSKDALYEYTGYLRDALVLYSVEKCSDSLRVRTQNPSKSYVVDIGLVQMFVAPGKVDLGRKLDNMVYLYLKHNLGIDEICYYRDGIDIDLVFTMDGEKVYLNVAYDITDPATARRETDSLIKILQKDSKSQPMLAAVEANLNYIPENIKFIPVEKLLLTGFN
jgi:predicted AAA+ superfamily ATPase